MVRTQGIWLRCGTALLVALLSCSAEPTGSAPDAGFSQGRPADPGGPGGPDTKGACFDQIFLDDAGAIRDILTICPQRTRPYDDLPDPLKQRGNPAPYR